MKIFFLFLYFQPSPACRPAPLTLAGVTNHLQTSPPTLGPAHHHRHSIPRVSSTIMCPGHRSGVVGAITVRVYDISSVDFRVLMLSLFCVCMKKLHYSSFQDKKQRKRQALVLAPRMTFSNHGQVQVALPSPSYLRPHVSVNNSLPSRNCPPWLLSYLSMNFFGYSSTFELVFSRSSMSPLSSQSHPRGRIFFFPPDEMLCVPPTFR